MATSRSRKPQSFILRKVVLSAPPGKWLKHSLLHLLCNEVPIIFFFYKSPSVPHDSCHKRRIFHVLFHRTRDTLRIPHLAKESGWFHVGISLGIKEKIWNAADWCCNDWNACGKCFHKRAPHSLDE